MGRLAAGPTLDTRGNLGFDVGGAFGDHTIDGVTTDWRPSTTYAAGTAGWGGDAGRPVYSLGAGAEWPYLTDSDGPWGIRVLAILALRTSGMGGTGVEVGLDLSAFRVVRSGDASDTLVGLGLGASLVGGSNPPASPDYALFRLNASAEHLIDYSRVQ
jgi:hypothetical protein